MVEEHGAVEPFLLGQADEDAAALVPQLHQVDQQVKVRQGRRCRLAVDRKPDE